MRDEVGGLACVRVAVVPVAVVAYVRRDAFGLDSEVAAVDVPVAVLDVGGACEDGELGILEVDGRGEFEVVGIERRGLVGVLHKLEGSLVEACLAKEAATLVEFEHVDAGVLLQISLVNEGDDVAVDGEVHRVGELLRVDEYQLEVEAFEGGLPVGLDSPSDCEGVALGDAAGS